MEAFTKIISTIFSFGGTKEQLNLEDYTKIISIIFAFGITALFRWVIIPRLGLLPTGDSGFFYQIVFVIFFILVFIGSLLGVQFIIRTIWG